MEERKACPCLHTMPCNKDCTCVKPWMSRGCSRCCSYGSPEQQKAKAEYLAKLASLKPNEIGLLTDNARVEVGLIGPTWSPLMRIRIFMNHKPEDHLTIWNVEHLSKIFGTYTPPGWFLKIIGQIK